jgi:hypothetical protein
MSWSRSPRWFLQAGAAARDSPNCAGSGNTASVKKAAYVVTVPANFVVASEIRIRLDADLQH